MLTDKMIKNLYLKLTSYVNLIDYSTSRQLSLKIYNSSEEDSKELVFKKGEDSEQEVIEIFKDDTIKDKIESIKDIVELLILEKLIKDGVLSDSINNKPLDILVEPKGIYLRFPKFIFPIEHILEFNIRGWFIKGEVKERIERLKNEKKTNKKELKE